MNYKDVYDRIIASAVDRNLPRRGTVVIETHHIVPKSCGGTNNKDNLVTLIPKEHYLCHLLLERIYRGTEHHSKMQRAAFMMGRCSTRTSRAYQTAKEAHINTLKNQVISDDQKQAISKKNKGNTYKSGMLHSEETKQKIGKGNTGKIRSTELRELWSEQRKGSIPWNKGKTGYKVESYPKTRKPRAPMTPETIEKMRVARKKWHDARGHKING